MPVFFFSRLWLVFKFSFQDPKHFGFLHNFTVFLTQCESGPLIWFPICVAGFRRGGCVMSAGLWVWAKKPNRLLYLCLVWTGATVQPWGAALMSFLLACSQLCCCLRSAPASNGCKYCQEAAISLCRRDAIFTRLYIQTMSQQMLSLRCMILCGSLLLHVCAVFLALGFNGSLEMGPNIPQVAPDQGEECVVYMCIWWWRR